MITWDEKKPYDVVVMGRATIDLYANEIGPMEEAKTFSKYVGGSTANTAVALSRLGMKVGYIGKVSDDQFGRFIKNYFAENGIDTSHVENAEPGIRSGVTMGEIRKDSASFFVYRKDCADLQICCSQLDEAYIAKHKLLLISGTSLSHSPAREAVFAAIQMAHRHGVRVALDLDYREDTWDTLEQASVYYTLAAGMADIVLGTRDEFDVMERTMHPGNYDNARSAAWLTEEGVSLVSIKQGKRGSLVYLADGSVFRGGIYPTKVLKSFGAGDAYSGAFLSSLLRGRSVSEGLMAGAAAASIAITGHSCSDAMPTLAELETYMAAHEYQNG